METFEADYYSVVRNDNRLFSISNPKRCTLLHMAIAEGDIELVKELASRKLLLEKPAIDRNSKLTPLLQAVMNGNLTIIQILLDAQADPNVQLAKGLLFTHERNGSTHVTPLMIAARMGRKDIVEVLLQAGANPNEKDGNDVGAWTMKEYAEAYQKG